MNENIKEKISALADGELSEFEVRRVLDEIEKEPDLRNYWDLLQITRRSLTNEDLGNIGIDISGRVRRELSGRKPHVVEEDFSYSRYKSYLAATAGLALVFGVNFFLTPSYTDTGSFSFSEEASQTIANAIASPEAMEVLNNSVLGMDARLKDFNYVSGGGYACKLCNSRRWQESSGLACLRFYQNTELGNHLNYEESFIKTDKGVFVVSVSGNITDEKKSKNTSKCELLL